MPATAAQLLDPRGTAASWTRLNDIVELDPARQDRYADLADTYGAS